LVFARHSAGRGVFTDERRPRAQQRRDERLGGAAAVVALTLVSALD
jgi:hypothetical protein